MNKLITIIIVAAALGTYAERPPLPGAYRHNAEVRQKQNKEQEKTKKKLTQYKTDEGVCGTRVWKEYTANQKDKGEPTLFLSLPQNRQKIKKKKMKQNHHIL